jgi:hypothetical protein
MDHKLFWLLCVAVIPVAYIVYYLFLRVMVWYHRVMRDKVKARFEVLKAEKAQMEIRERDLKRKSRDMIRKWLEEGWITKDELFEIANKFVK